VLSLFDNLFGRQLTSCFCFLLSNHTCVPVLFLRIVGPSFDEPFYVVFCLWLLAVLVSTAEVDFYFGVCSQMSLRIY